MPNPPRTYQKASGVYYIRLLVPKFLHHISKNTKIAFSLGTKDRRQANIHALQINLAFEQWIDEMAKNRFGSVVRELQVKLPNGMELDFDLKKTEEREAYESLMHDVEKIGVRSNRNQLRPPTVPTFKLNDVFETYKQAKRGVYSEATKDGYYPRIKGFIEFCCERDILVIDEVRAHLAVEYREKIQLEKKSPLTVDNYTKTLKMFFEYAIDSHKYNSKNPFADLNIVPKSQMLSVTESYLPFSANEIIRLFNTENFTNKFKKPDYFFSPLIALTMGLRLEEVAQLHISDIYQINGIWVIDINGNGPLKEVKNNSAKRILPITRHVLDTNFLQYFEYIKLNYGETSLLYPYLIKTKNGFGKNLGYNFSQYKKALIEIDPTQKAFHSLRKTVGNLMKQNELELTLRKRILGHSMQNDVTETVYSGDYGLEYIKHSLDSIDYGIKFSEFFFEFNQSSLENLINSMNGKLRRNDAVAEREERRRKESSRSTV